MTLEKQLTPTKRFVPALLPWLLAAGFFLIYLLTLNHWVSFGGLFQAAKGAGLAWQPDAYDPLNWLVTSACHLLPAKLVPLALNLFSAVCAALTLALLARSVALLPHDRTEEQRSRERGAFAVLSIPLAWLPVVLAVVVCGLQLTFWENATAPSNFQPPWQSGTEMLDLVLFAYVICCLLEYRIDEKESRLLRASFVYGLAMTNNWAMIGFFPVFLLALGWLMGMGFFNPRFLTRMFLWGSLGLLFYLLLPITQSLADTSPFSFWQLLKTNLVGQKTALFTLVYNKNTLLNGMGGDQPFWVLALPSLLPLLVLGIRWPSYFGDPSKLGVTLTTLIFHFFHAFLLLLCVWVAFDPQVSPRHALPGMPMLTLYYLGALSAGYFSGYFLLVFRPKPQSRKRPSPLQVWLNNASVAGVSLLLLTATVVLLYRNLPQIRLTNGPMLKDYAALQLDRLPHKHAVVLSDNPQALYLIQFAALREGLAENFLFLDTSSLAAPEYHRYLKHQYPQRWSCQLPADRTKRVDDIPLLQAVARLAQTNEIFYLHPSFGFYFEAFYPEPHGLCYQLKSYPNNDLLAPIVSTNLIRENEAFWSELDGTTLQPLLAAVSPATSSPTPHGFPSSVLDPLIARLHLAKNDNMSAIMLADWYSRALDFWGVELQKAGQLQPAGIRFATALKLNPDNRAALANQQANTGLQEGRKLEVLDPKVIEERFGKYRTLEPLLTENGPFDDPTLCYEQGRAFASGGNLRQAVQYFERSRELAPDHLPSRFWLAQLYSNLRRPKQVLGVIHEIQSNTNLFAASRSFDRQLLFFQTSAYLANNDAPSAAAVARAALKSHPNDEALLGTVTQVYMNGGYYSNALDTVDQLLQLAPTNSGALANKGYLYLQMGCYTQAIPVLSKVLAVDTNSQSTIHNSALFNRAIAYLRSEQFDSAQHDYEALQSTYPTAYQVFYGLGEVAYHKKDTNAAIHNFELYLTNCPVGNTETNFVIARLKELTPPGSP